MLSPLFYSVDLYSQIIFWPGRVIISLDTILKRAHFILFKLLQHLLPGVELDTYSVESFLSPCLLTNDQKLNSSIFRSLSLLLFLWILFQNTDLNFIH